MRGSQVLEFAQVQGLGSGLAEAVVTLLPYMQRRSPMSQAALGLLLAFYLKCYFCLHRVHYHNIISNIGEGKETLALSSPTWFMRSRYIIHVEPSHHKVARIGNGRMGMNEILPISCAAGPHALCFPRD